MSKVRTVRINSLELKHYLNDPDREWNRYSLRTDGYDKEVKGPLEEPIKRAFERAGGTLVVISSGEVYFETKL